MYITIAHNEVEALVIDHLRKRMLVIEKRPHISAQIEGSDDKYFTGYRVFLPNTIPSADSQQNQEA